MLTIISPAIITTALLLCATGCDNKDYSNASPFDNVVYLDAAKLKDVSNFTFNRTIETGQKEISALLARPAGEDINVGIKVDASLVNTYNARLGANYTMLDAKHYKLSAGQTVIPQGEVSSKPVTIDFSGLTDLEIVDTYNSQTRGICNYYCIASNFSKLTYFVYLMEYSCLKTLAKKHKTRISGIKRIFKCGKSWGIPYKTKKEKKRMMIVKFSDFKRGTVFDEPSIDTVKNHIHFNTRNSLEARLKACKCELCGAEGDGIAFEIHHINKMKNLKGKEQWEMAMIARKRKTLVVCKECHKKIHHSS